ncbi:MAG: hypothetical protein ACJ78Q_00220 [Chloroflexia bacterium]
MNRKYWLSAETGIMARCQEITRSLALDVATILIGLTIFLLSGCENSGSAAGTVSTKVPAPALTEVPRLITPEPNFAFALEWYSCYSYKIDTFNNTLTLISNMSPPVTTTIDFVLSQQELGRISQRMASIDFFSYPDDFSIQLPPDVMRVSGIPVRYLFKVQSGNQTKVVHWKDEFGEPTEMPWRDEYSEPSKTRAIKLRELIKLVQQIVEGHPEFSKLPSPGGCA